MLSEPDAKSIFPRTANAAARMMYPAAPRGDVIDVYHGRTVPDPYRWLEDGDSPATRAWIEAEAGLTEQFLATRSPSARQSGGA